MEPVAPGTEEDLPHAPLVSKKTNEEERLLSVKAYLVNGQYDNVFELTYRNGSQHWYCKVCKCPIMGRVFYHESGRRHSLNIETYQYKFAPKNTVPEEVAEPEGQSIKVISGEPVPPGFEGEVTKVAQIQDRLNSFTSGSLLGLEYLLEIQDYDHDKEPSYLCLLCWKKGDPRTVIAHLVSYNHLQGYLQRHFPKTYQALAPYVTRQFKKNWQDTMNKIVEAIESKYGRLLPHPVDAETFERKKDELYQMVHTGPHFSEKNGISFEHLINKEEITKVVSGNNDMPEKQDPPEKAVKPPKKRSPSPPVVNRPKKPKTNATPGRRRSLSSVSSISSSGMSDFEEKKKKNNEEKVVFKSRPALEKKQEIRSRSPRPRPKPRQDRVLPSPKRNDRRSPSPRRGRRKELPWNRPDYGKTKSGDRRSRSRDNSREDKLAKFKRLSQAIENDMEKVLKQHKLNPEKHPQYNEEWKIFWNKRYKELQGEGKDASKYDFKPEWILYWNEKIVEIHKAEVKTKIESLSKRLGITEPAPVSFKIGGKKREAGDTKLVPMAHPDNDYEVIVIDDKDDSISPRRSHSPWESETVQRSHRHSERRLSLDRISSPERDIEPSRNKSSREKERDRDRYMRRSPSWDRGKSDYRSRDYRSRDKSWERDISYHRESRKDPKLDPYKPSPIMRDVTRKPVDYNRMKTTPEIEDDGDVNIVAVLRLLTALEDKLGSLGPKVIDMLGTALAMEKKEANSSETLLDNEINCVLFETVKEKLKGALHAELVDYTQERAFKTAIKKIASLVHIASTRKTEVEIKVDPVKVPGVGTVDKAAIAKQIATALVLQGKTDVTHAELEQLINAVVGMAEASKNSDKPMTTASFLEKLSTKAPEETKPVEIKVVSEPVQSTSTMTVETQASKDSMDGLSDSDLQTLLQNFKDLSSEEQQGLITYLKKLEAKEPERVEKLRKFVNLSMEETNTDSGRVIKEIKPDPVRVNKEVHKDSGRVSTDMFADSNRARTDTYTDSGRESPFSRKLNETESHNPTVHNNFLDFEDDVKSDVEEQVEEVKKEPPKMRIDSDDEEYSFEDVFKAASKNVEESKKVKERKIIEDTIKHESSKNEEDMLTDAKALIANIMGSIAAKVNQKNDNAAAARNVQPLQLNPIVNNRPAPQIVQHVQPVPVTSPSVQQQVVQNSPVKSNPVNPNVNPNMNRPQQYQPPGGYNAPRGPVQFNNQPVQYPMKNQYPAAYTQNYANNYSNQFMQNSRFQANRGQFANVNNRGNPHVSNRGNSNVSSRGNSNFNNRW